MRDVAAISPIIKGMRTQKTASVSAADICWPLGVARDERSPTLCHQMRRAWVLNQETTVERLRCLKVRVKQGCLWFTSFTNEVTPVTGAIARFSNSLAALLLLTG